jgi:ectoine/hydroxyectoine ABC transporter permease protein EhuD
MNDVLEFLPALLRGAALTVGITIASMAIALVLGLLIALARMSPIGPVRWAMAIYVDFIRGTPLLLQLFYIYYVLPYVGIYIPALIAGILGLSLNYAAYLSEVYRSAISAIGKGQVEAARSLGMRPAPIFMLVVLPQALRIAIPPIGNYFIAMFKDTALVAVISVNELMFTADQIASTTYKYLEVYTAAFVIYFIVSYPASMLILKIEDRMKRAPAG